MEDQEVYQKSFIPYVVKLGRATNFIGCFVMFIPCIVLLAMGISPGWSAVLSACIMRFSVGAAFYVVEPVAYFPALGIPGTYMSCLTGNSANMRVPCALVAQEAANVKQGTPEGAILSTVGVAASVVVNALILTLTVVGGSALLRVLPESITSMFNYLLPALFGSMFASNVIRYPKVAMIAIPLGVGMTVAFRQGWLVFIPSFLRNSSVLLVAVLGTILLSVKLLGNNPENGKEHSE